MMPPLTGVFSLSFFRFTTGQRGTLPKQLVPPPPHQFVSMSQFFQNAFIPILGSTTSSMLGTGVGSSMSLVKSSSGSCCCCRCCCPPPRLRLEQVRDLKMIEANLRSGSPQPEIIADARAPSAKKQSCFVVLLTLFASLTKHRKHKMILIDKLSKSKRNK